MKIQNQIQKVINHLSIEQSKIIETPTIPNGAEDNRMRDAYCKLEEQIDILRQARKLLIQHKA